jgi:MFS family permease
MISAQSRTPPVPRAAEPVSYGELQAWIAVIILDLQFFLQGIDTAIVTLLVKPIETALGVNDVGFATITATPITLGTALMFYPAGWLSDSFRRRDIITAGTFVWTAASFATAFVHTPAVFFVMRLIAGAGFGLIVPAAFSMLCDLLPSKRGAAVFGVFNAGLAIGTGVALTSCGFLVAFAEGHRIISFAGGAFAPWQQCFAAVSALGVVSLLLAFLIREPPRRELAAAGVIGVRETFGAFITYIREHAALWTTLFSGTALSIMSFLAIVTWAPTFGARHFHAEGVGAVAWLGSVSAGGALLGAILSAAFAQRGLKSGRTRLPLLLAAVAIITVVFAATFPYMPSWTLAVLGMGVVTGSGQAINMLFSIVFQEAVPNQVRGQLSGLNALIGSVPGIASPTLVAFTADHALARFGGLGPALSIIGGLSAAMAAVLFIACRKSYYAAVREVVASRVLTLISEG